MTDLMAVCGTECLADVHIMSHDEYNGVSFYHLLVLISRMDMDKFDSIWFMFSTYNMDGNFFIMEDTVAIRVGHGNGKQKATARANSLCWSLPRCRQDWQQNLEVRSNTFSCRQQKSGLPATLFFAGNRKQSFQATTLSAGNARQFSGNKKSNFPATKKATCRRKNPETLPEFFLSLWWRNND